jgi:hypothetical protein
MGSLEHTKMALQTALDASKMREKRGARPTPIAGDPLCKTL